MAEIVAESWLIAKMFAAMAALLPEPELLALVSTTVLMLYMNVLIVESTFA